MTKEFYIAKYCRKRKAGIDYDGDGKIKYIQFRDDIYNFDPEKLFDEIVNHVKAVVKHEIAEDDAVVIWGEPLRKKKNNNLLDDFSDCKLPSLPEDCDATESDIY